MKRSFFLVCVALASQVTLGQSVPCPDPKLKAACESFKELLANKDADLLERRKSDVALVCFREKEDGFFTVNWRNPGDRDWDVTLSTPDKKWEKRPLYSAVNDLDEGYKETGGPAQQAGVVEITYYKNGVLESSRSFWGEWLADVTDLKKGKVQSRREMQSGPDDKTMNGEGQSISLDPSTLIASYSFTNVSKMTTDYALTIQMATKRFF
jgi:hypothetical protein